LREVFCLVLEFGEEKQNFAKVEGDNVNFFPKRKTGFFGLFSNDSTGPFWAPKAS
jgi:hypothetical protein